MISIAYNSSSALRLVFTALLALLTACSARQEPRASVEASEVDSDDDLEEEEGAVSDLEHPKAANAFATRALVNEANLPDTQAIATCREDLSAIGAAALNHAAMADAEEQTLNLVRENPSLYHWCFYVAVVHLDLTMGKMRATLDVVAEKFYESFRDLWILARALDRYDQDNAEYFVYLRKRYIQLSRDYFGRDLEMNGPSAVDLRVGEKRRITASPPKPAATVEVE